MEIPSLRLRLHTSSIHPLFRSFIPRWCPLHSLSLDYLFSLFCAFLFNLGLCISSFYHSFTTSSHSLRGLPLVVFPSISPSPVCYLPSCRCDQNNFNFAV